MKYQQAASTVAFQSSALFQALALLLLAAAPLVFVLFSDPLRVFLYNTPPSQRLIMPPFFLPFAVKLMALHLFLLLIAQRLTGPLRFLLTLGGLPCRIVVFLYPLK